MPQIKLENTYLFKVANFLRGVESMPAKQSRARTKLVKSLMEKGAEYIESQKQVVEELGGQVQDEDLKIVFTEDNVEAKHHVKEYLDELSKEVVVIDESFIGQFAVLKKFFSDWDGEVKSMDADGYDKLLDTLDEL